MMSEGRLLRVAVLASVVLHIVVLAFIARRGGARPIALDQLRVVAVGTYTPPAPKPELSLPRSLERRPPVPRPGLALVGDAATASDPVPAVGCTWAFRSAESLADATIPALQAHARLGPALRDYRRRHRFIDRHDRLIRADARGGRANPIQRALRQAAPHDPEIASRLGRFAMRAVPVSGLVNPRTIVRAVRVARRSGGGEGIRMDEAGDRGAAPVSATAAPQR